MVADAQLYKHGFTPSVEMSTEGNLDITVVDIAEGGLAGIAELLSGLYQDGPFAIFREYVSNAYDSHVKAGTVGVKPIEITVSDHFSKTFITWDGEPIANKTFFCVQDYGTGMSHDEMKNVYAKYGGTTKKGDRTTIGRYGVGAKSGLSISGYFEVVSVKDGEKVTATIEKDNNTGLSHMFTKKIEKVDEPNGTKVSVPVSTSFSYNISGRLRDYFNTWGENTVLLNGAAPTHLNRFNNKDQFLAITNYDGSIAGWIEIKTSNKNPKSQANLYMGGVPYTLASHELRGYVKEKKGRVNSLFDNNYSIILNMPLESLELTPNREQVKNTVENTKRFQDAYTQLETLIEDSALTYLNSLTKNKAHLFWSYNVALFQQKDSTIVPPVYRGEPLNLTVDFSGYEKEEIEWYSPRQNYAYQSSVYGFMNFKVPVFNTGKTLSEGYFSYQRETGVIETIVVWGLYTGKASSVFATHSRNAMKQEGNERIDYVNVLHLKTDVEPTQQILDSFKVYHMDEILALSKKWREANYSTPVRKPRVSHKTVENSYYTHFSLNENGDVVAEPWDKKDLKEATEEFYYIPEEFAHKKEYSTQRTRNSWDDDRKQFRTIEPTIIIPHGFDDVVHWVKTLQKPIVTVPYKKSLDVVTNAAKDKAKPLAVLVEQWWEDIDEVMKTQIGICWNHKAGYTFRNVRKNIHLVENETVKEALIAAEDKKSSLYSAMITASKLETKISFYTVTGYKLYNSYISQLQDGVHVELFNKMVELTDI